MENIIRKFEWESKWLKGDEYHNILMNITKYSEQFSMRIYPKKCHPSDIYSNPTNGLIYFIKGENIESDFGFPRVEMKKIFKWKKMNFTADLPKKRPLVKYLVASASKIGEKGKPLFRMHAVVLNEPAEESYILCHVRQLQLENGKEGGTKKAKREEMSPSDKGLELLLEAATKVISPIKDMNKENDYVQMFRNSKFDKFSTFSTPFKPLFVITKKN